MKTALLIAIAFFGMVAAQAQQNCSKPIDIMLILDESGSISSSDFNLLKSFSINFANAFNFGPQFTKMGAVTFDTTSRLVIQMTTDKPTFVNGVNAIVKHNGNTCIGCGIQTGQQEFGTRGRAGVTKVMIVLTDGVNNINTVNFNTAITNAKNAGILMVSVGVGPGVDVNQLKAIASTNGGSLLYYTQPSFSALAGFVDSLTQLVCVDIPVIPTAICGNGIIETGEDCDGGDCCTTTCKFASATTTCRASGGECDFAEKCSGTSSDCPTDVIKPKGTACGEFFGMCDVRIEKTCDGVSPKCFGPPAAPLLSNIISWEDFNVISFNTFYCHGGDVEGRLAARNSVDLAGFSLGLALTSAVDGFAPYSLFVAGDASWTDGSLWPDGTQVGDYVAEAFVGGTFTAPDYLLNRRSALFTTAEANDKFDAAQTYFVQLQSQLSSIPTNANYEIKYTNGLFITCDATADLYHVKVDGDDYSKIDWISLQGCKFSARWIVEITGTGNVVIKGQPFPGIVERVIYNIVGTGRTITGQTGIGGHILAPQNTYTQNSGVTYGKVVVGNFPESRQSNKPNCVNFKSVTISSIVLKPVQIGDTRVYVADLSNFVAGDLVCIGGNCRKLVAGEVGDFDGDGVVDHVVTFAEAFPDAILANTPMTTAVDANTGDNRTPFGNNPNGSNASGTLTGASSTLAVCFALIFAFLAFF